MDVLHGLHVNLAPSFGKLESVAVRAEIILAHIQKILGNIPAEERSWERVMSIMDNDSLLEPAGEQAVVRTDSLAHRGTNVFKFDGSPDAAIVKEVSRSFLTEIAMELSR